MKLKSKEARPSRRELIDFLLQLAEATCKPPDEEGLFGPNGWEGWMESRLDEQLLELLEREGVIERLKTQETRYRISEKDCLCGLDPMWDGRKSFNHHIDICPYCVPHQENNSLTWRSRKIQKVAEEAEGRSGDLADKD